MPWHHFVVYLVTALLLGAIIGAERQWHQRIAGLRTNALVSGGAAMFVSLSHLLPLTPTSLQVAAQVVSGIGFLGAGVIMREGLSIRGLNTAATLWCSAAVGSLCGLGFVREAAIGAACVVGANILFRPLARRIDRQPSAATDVETHYVLRLVCCSDDEAKIRVLLMHLLHALPITLNALHSEDVNSSGKVEVRATLVSAERKNAMLEDIVQRLSLESGVSAVSWELAPEGAERITSNRVSDDSTCYFTCRMRQPQKCETLLFAWQPSRALNSCCSALDYFTGDLIWIEEVGCRSFLRPERFTDRGKQSVGSCHVCHALVIHEVQTVIDCLHAQSIQLPV